MMATRDPMWREYLILMCLIAGVSSIGMFIIPRHAAVRHGDNLHVTCRVPAGHSLESCKFFITGMPAIDFSLGRESQATDDYKYYGRGLENGVCGITLLQVARNCNESKIITVTCAAKVKGFGWTLNYMSAIISNLQAVPLMMEKHKIIAEPGSNVTITCSSGGVPLTSCFFEGRNLGHIDLSQGANGRPSVIRASTGSEGKVAYFGDGLLEGDCGITLVGVKDDWNGLVWCAAKSEYGNWGYDYTTLVVKKLPQPPILELRSQILKLGETLNASCVVNGFRQSVNLNWEPPFDEEITNVYNQDFTKAVLDFEEQTTAQRSIKRTVVTDHLKSVQCTATYNDQQNEVTAAKKILVKFCGIRNLKGARPLVFGGVISQHGEFPWHAGLYEKASDTHKYLCGGSLISTKFVVTAAHCLWNRTLSRVAAASSYSVALGKFSIRWKEEEFAQRFDVATVFAHSRYDDISRKFDNDIALLKLAGEAVFSTNIHPICVDWDLTQEWQTFVGGRTGIVPGWGFTEQGNLSSVLRYAELPIMQDTDCQQTVPLHFRSYLSPGKYCAGYLNESVAVCSGDSGGGMVFYQNDTMRYYLMGVVSIAPKLTNFGCNSEQVAVFTRVPEHTPWIKGILEEEDPMSVLESTA